MNQSGLRYVLLSLLLASPLALAEGPTDAALKAEAAAIVKRFGGSLKPKLVGAIQSGGLANAIDVCAVEAPAIAARLSEETGWQVRRVSLKPRNLSAASPDPFERAVLEQFDQRRADGEDPATLVTAQRVDDHYRFIKAQVVEGLCLNCHGQSLSPEVSEALRQHYPGDTATGYTLGQVRGAFSLVRELPQAGAGINPVSGY